MLETRVRNPARKGKKALSSSMGLRRKDSGGAL